VIPGGGHAEIWIDHEGYRVAHWLSERGVAAFVLKYRLAKQAGSPYTVERDELADAQRAIRYVRAHAGEWNINAERVGVLGFSAGGELALLAGTRPGTANPAAPDAIERQSATPSFMALMYPAIPANLTLQAGLPPAFLMCGEGDSPEIASGVPALYSALRAAGDSAELHILAHVGHGFGMRVTNSPAVANWTTTFYDWLDAGGFLKRP
jgi:endo-1,4-beta-xylanase